MANDETMNANVSDPSSVGKYVYISGHRYLIISVSSDYCGMNGGNHIELLRVPDDEQANHLIDLYGYLEGDIPNEDNKLINLVQSFRGSIGEGNIKMLNEMKYIQTVINLVEGLPASKVAESLDKAAKYVRNQAVTGHWDDNLD